MMLSMVRFTVVVIETCIQPQTQLPRPLIDQTMPWRQAVVHGVMTKDK
jgi:hypothetical protein